MPVIPAFGELRQEDYEFKTNPGYTETLSQNKQTNKQTKKRLVCSPHHLLTLGFYDLMVIGVRRRAKKNYEPHLW
jgi:hypothetical protein